MSADPIHVAAELVVTSDARGRERADFAAKAFLSRYGVATTRKGYALALSQWFQWCDEHFVDPLAAKRYHIEIFTRELEATGRMPSTVAAKLNALAGFYKFAMSDEFIRSNPMVHVRRPSIERESTTVGLTRPELADLVTVAKKAPPQDHALIMILAYNGLRVAEICGIDIEHLDRYKGGPTVHIVRKGGKRQQIPFAFPTAFAIERVLDSHPKGTGPLFLSREGNRIDRKGVGRVVKRLYIEAGIAKRGHPHALRHTFVTLSRDAGESDRDHIASTGHADGRMVEYYDRGRDKVERNVTHGLAAYVERAT